MKTFAKHFKKLSIILCLIPSPALAEFRHFDDWSTEEKLWFTGYQAAAWVDYSQTKWALTHPCECFYEQNPLYGRYPHPDKILLGNVLAAVGTYWYVGSNQENEKLLFLQGATAFRAAVVIHNDSVGISWSAGL